MTTYEEALEFLNSAQRFGSKLGLGRIQELMNSMGNPEDSLRFVHIAGTNGKGSTAAFISCVLSDAGYRTGCFISPYIQRFTERISVDGVEISPEDVLRHTQAIKNRIDQMLAQGLEHPTAFEIYTAMCFLHFKEQACDIVVLETGLGGSIDSTNVIKTKEAAVITNIGYDHMEQLGNTLEEIAGKKAGIITSPTEVVLYPFENEDVLRVFEARAGEFGANVHKVDAGDVRINGTFLKPCFSFMNLEDIRIQLLGRHQYNNAAVAINTLRVLRKKGYDIADSCIYSGLARARWPGRMEIMQSSSPMVIVDGAHNSQGAQALAKALKDLEAADITFVVGAMRDKDAEEMIRAVSQLAARFLTVAPANPRAASAEELHSITSGFAESFVCQGVAQALGFALSTTPADGLVCCFGSLYFVGEVRSFFGKK